MRWLVVVEVLTVLCLRLWCFTDPDVLQIVRRTAVISPDCSDGGWSGVLGASMEEAGKAQRARRNTAGWSAPRRCACRKSRSGQAVGEGAAGGALGAEEALPPA